LRRGGSRHARRRNRDLSPEGPRGRDRSAAALGRGCARRSARNLTRFSVQGGRLAKQRKTKDGKGDEQEVVPPPDLPAPDAAKKGLPSLSGEDEGAPEEP